MCGPFATPSGGGNRYFMLFVDDYTRWTDVWLLPNKQAYQAIVGSLMCIALATRPDISYAVSALSRYNSRPLASHLTAAKRVLHYLKTTAHHRLHFQVGEPSGSGDGKLMGYTDSDWANDSKDRKSQGGHVFIIGGGAVSWQSRKQNLVATSTLEAEYIACSEASREARWL